MARAPSGLSSPASARWKEPSGMAARPGKVATAVPLCVSLLGPGFGLRGGNFALAGTVPVRKPKSSSEIPPAWCGTQRRAVGTHLCCSRVSLSGSSAPHTLHCSPRALLSVFMPAASSPSLLNSSRWMKPWGSSPP